MRPVVVFDLWRTLVPLEVHHKRVAMDGTAAALGSDTDAFRATWAQTRRQRETQPLRSYLLALQEAVGARWTEEQLEAAMKARREAHYAAFAHVREGAREVLSELRAAGVGLALVSNCSSDVRWMLTDSGLGRQFDHLALSAEVGLMKPDPAIFETAVRALRVETAWYVGDGDDGELAGARSAGLTDVLLDLDEGRDATLRIKSLREVPALIQRKFP